MIYLDNAASTPVLPLVKKKIIECLDIYGNPSSIHNEGQRAKALINEATKIIAKKINCKEDEIYYTTGATMSNNIVMQGFYSTIITSKIEHDDILLMGETFRRFRLIGVNNKGFINTDELISELEDYKGAPILVSIQMANGEIGTIQDIKRISEIVHSYPCAFLHTDATQYIPYYQIDVKDMGIDALSMSGQKIGCIKGTGLLYLSNQLKPFIDPLIYGNQGFIGGTENVLGIACLGEAFKELNYNTELMYKRDLLIEQLDGILVGDDKKRTPNNVCMLFKNIDSYALVYLLNEHGIYCSSGSACSSNVDKPSSTLLAIGLGKDAESCVRFTLNSNITTEDILYASKVINYAVKMLRG